MIYVDLISYLDSYYDSFFLLIMMAFIISKLGDLNMMENKETTSPPKAIDDNSEHVSKLVHQFYFVKLWPIDQDSICKIKVEENVVKKMNQDISEITESITKKMV